MGGAVLFLPAPALSFMGLQHLFDLALLIGAEMMAVQLSDLSTMVQQAPKDRSDKVLVEAKRETLRKRILRLTDEEKAIVWTFQQGRTATWFDAQNPMAHGLAAQDILLQTAVNGSAYEVAFTLQP